MLFKQSRNWCAAHTFDQMRALLSGTTMVWKGGDNDIWGEYFVNVPADGQPRLRIFRDGDRYVIDISRVPTDTALAEAVRIVRDEVLTLLDARDIEDHSGWE